MSTEKVFILGILGFAVSIVFSILYFNLEKQNLLKNGIYEECIVVLVGNNSISVTEKILVKNCNEVLTKYIEIQENNLF
jgi:hypothetical protein